MPVFAPTLRLAALSLAALALVWLGGCSSAPPRSTDVLARETSSTTPVGASAPLAAVQPSPTTPAPASATTPAPARPTSTAIPVATATPMPATATPPLPTPPLPTPTLPPPTSTAGPPTETPTETPVPPTATPSPQQRLLVARAMIGANNFDGALGLLESVAASDPEIEGLDELLYRAHLGNGRALLERNDLDGSSAHFAHALELRPGDPASLAGLQGVALARRWEAVEAAVAAGDEAAIELLEEIVQIDYAYRDAWAMLYALLVARADRLLVEEEYDAARQALTRALEVHPNGEEARERLAAYEGWPAPSPPGPPPR